MIIPQSKLKRILDIYPSNCRYLAETDQEYPKAEGIFRIDKLFYTTEPFEHLSVIEALVCLNQLTYSAFGEWFSEGKFKEKIEFEKYLKLMKENMFIIEADIRFKQTILKEKEIKGELKLRKLAQQGNNLMGILEYDIENGKSIGSLKLALKP